MRKKFKREISALDEIFEFADNFITVNEIGDAVAFSTRLTVLMPLSVLARGTTSPE